MLLALASWSRFFEISALGLTLGLAIDEAESIGGKITIGLSE